MAADASLKRSDMEAGQRVTCAACRVFVEVVGGIRGEAFEEEGRRHFYTVMPHHHLRASRCGPRYVVTPYFFHGVHNACGRWLVDHLDRETIAEYAENDPRRHLAAQDLPPWVPLLIRDIDFDRLVGRDAVVTVCAALLGISRQQVYAQLSG
jgi:hypothetical protein